MGKIENNLYKGTFNWFGEVHTLYTHAPSLPKAHTNLFHQLADKVGYHFSYISIYYNLGKHEYQINQEVQNGQKNPEIHIKERGVQQSLFPGTPFAITRKG